MHEFEIKFQVPRARRAAVEAALRRHPAPARLRLQARYFDTADTRLAAARMALRVRREGDLPVQTLKAAGAGALGRFEHNVPLAEVDGLAADPRRHAGTSGGEQLLALLAASPAPLAERYRTDIRRLARRAWHRGALLELAFDEGVIAAGERHTAVCELEIELLEGVPADLLDHAARWVRRHGLWLDTRSKAERGERLARAGAGPEPVAPPRPLPRAPGRGAGAAARRDAAVRTLAAVLAAQSELAAGSGGTAHLAALRAGLRRLARLLRLIAARDGRADAASLAPRCAALGEGLPAAAGAALTARLRGAPVQRLWLELLALD
ncbi:CYTH domain-containing protein [Caldimonas tepidiphila]|uniref:CYTH domain-containing protein n=1 Tax=Caldimonas tepidiphila TaxID=2315841 RepID=UPI000E5A9A1D|nr:CYTH domain-containing protein [Caldimonas tepidiphila]